MNAENSFRLRQVRPQDAPRLLEIYTPFVESADRSVSDVSFEYAAPAPEEWRERLANICRAYPYLTAERQDGLLVGYAYAHPYIERAAYQGNAEVTIYLAPEGQGQGLGRALYTALERILAAMGVVNAYACITASNERSLRLHRALGYTLCGSFPRSGFKNGHWLDMVWLAKQIAPYPEKLRPLQNVHSLPQGCVQRILDEVNAALPAEQNNA